MLLRGQRETVKTWRGTTIEIAGESLIGNHEVGIQSIFNLSLVSVSFVRTALLWAPPLFSVPLPHPLREGSSSLKVPLCWYCLITSSPGSSLSSCILSSPSHLCTAFSFSSFSSVSIKFSRITQLTSLPESAFRQQANRNHSCQSHQAPCAVKFTCVFLILLLFDLLAAFGREDTRSLLELSNSLP